ncbi:hypothetical protein Tco_1466112 [Tanacetum coccineum]
MSSNPKAIALRMDSEPSDQSKRQAATKKRISQHEDYLILKSGSDMDRIDEAEHHEEDGELECKVLKSGCDMVGSIASQHSVEHRRPIKRMVLKVQARYGWAALPPYIQFNNAADFVAQMILKSTPDMDGQIALLHSIKHHWPNKRIVSRTVRYQTEPGSPKSAHVNLRGHKGISFLLVIFEPLTSTLEGWLSYRWYLLVSQLDLPTEDGGRPVICFDVEKEEFGLIDPPKRILEAAVVVKRA